MKITLVRPTKPYLLNMVAPIGLIALGSFLKHRFGGRVQVRVLDNRLERWDTERLVRRTLETEPEVVGITAMTHEVPEAVEFLRGIRASGVRPLCVAGGVHATAEPDVFLAAGNADYVVRGEGEETFAELVQALLEARDPRGLPGLAWREGPSQPAVQGPERPLIPCLDDLPSADYGLVELHRYFGWPSGDNLFHRPEHVGFMTSRGCPYRCGYCHNMFGHRFRPHSPGRVIRELQVMADEHGVREIHFWDDVFNLDRDRTLAICRGIVDAGLDVALAFPNGLRIERMDEEVLDALIRAGMRRISYGIESGDPRTLQAMKRYGDIEKIREVVRMTAARGVLTKGLFILGAPGETAEQMRNTVDLALSLPLHYVSFNRFIPMPSAPLGRELLARLENAPGWNDYNYECSDLNVSGVPADALSRIIRSANRRFYLRSRVIWNLLRLFPFRRQLLVMYLTWTWGYLFAVRRQKSRGMGIIRWVWSRVRPSS